MTDNTNDKYEAVADAVEALGRITVVIPNLRIWSGMRQITDTETSEAGGKALPARYGRNGAVIVFPKDGLNPFFKLRVRAQRVLQSAGVSFGKGAYALAVDTSAPVLSELDAICEEYQRELDTFRANYDSLAAQWSETVERENPAVASVIRRNQPSADSAVSRFSADYYTLQLTSCRDEDKGRMEKKVEELSTQLFDEISNDAEPICVQLAGRTRAERRHLINMTKLRDKLYGLSFLSYRIIPVLRMLDEVLSRAPTTGPLEDPYLHDFRAMVGIVANRHLLNEVAEGRYTFDAQKECDAASELTSAADGPNLFGAPAAEPEPPASAESPQKPESEPAAKAQDDDIDPFDAVAMAFVAGEKEGASDGADDADTGANDSTAEQSADPLEDEPVSLFVPEPVVPRPSPVLRSRWFA